MRSLRPGPLARSLVASGACITAAALVAPGAALASPTAKAGYVWANDPSSPTYVPAPAYQYDSLGGTITITRPRVGHYDVRFPGIGGTGGAIDLTTYGPDDVYCAATGIAPVGADEEVGVDCGNRSGTRVDAMFTLAWTTAIDGTAGAVAYTANLSDRSFSFDSAGGRPRVRHKSFGVYKVQFPNVPLGFPDRGTIKATPLSTDARGTIGFCAVQGLAPNRRGTATVATVRCFDSTGAPSDMLFSATYAQDIDLLGVNTLNSAYLWADQPRAGDYIPNPLFQFDNLDGRSAKVTRTDTGSYLAEFPLQANGFGTGGVQVTASASGPVHCQVEFWEPSGNSEDATVLCFDLLGRLSDSAFTLQWMRP